MGEVTEDSLFKLITEYEASFRANARAARERREAAAQKTKGKHSAALCQACLAGVCNYLISSQ